MAFQPKVHARLSVDSTDYRISEHPAAPGIPYGQEGRQAIVYRLEAESELRALKVFKPRFRAPALVTLTRRMESFADIPGLEVCRRVVLTPQKHGALLQQHPDLIYAVSMPWVQGPTWLEVVLEKRALSPKESLSVARSFADMLSAMEQRGVAHCDLSAPNVMLPTLAGGPGVALVDVEQMYGRELDRPTTLASGSSGYAHRTAPDGVWSLEADRFAGAVLLAEVLGWCDQRVRAAAWSESYFAPDEMQQDCERYHVLLRVLQDTWGDSVANLLSRAWQSEALADCATFGEWSVALPVKVSLDTSFAPDLEDVNMLLLQAARLDRDGKSSQALLLYRQILSRAAPNSPLQSEVALMVRTLEERESKSSPSDAVAPLITKARRLERQGDAAGALAAYREALALLPNGGLRDELELIVRDLEGRGTVDASSFVFRGGEQASSLEKIVHLCASRPEDAIWHLDRGDIESWMKRLGRPGLAREAEKARQSDAGDAVRLKGFLDATGISHNYRGAFVEVHPGAQRWRTTLKFPSVGVTVGIGCTLWVAMVLAQLRQTSGDLMLASGAVLGASILPMGLVLGEISRLHAILRQATEGQSPVSPAKAFWLHMIPIVNLFWIIIWPHKMGNFVNAERRDARSKPWIGWLSLFLTLLLSVVGLGWVGLGISAWHFRSVLKRVVEPVDESEWPESRQYAKGRRWWAVALLVVLGIVVLATAALLLLGPAMGELFRTIISGLSYSTAPYAAPTPNYWATAAAAPRPTATPKSGTTAQPSPTVAVALPTATVRALVATRTSTPILLIDKPAADMNLRVSDLGASYSLLEELGTDSFADADVKDGNYRYFDGEAEFLQSWVLVSRSVVEDTVSDFMSVLKDFLRNLLEDETFSFSAPVYVTLGDRGAIEEFTSEPSGAVGYLVVFMERNVGVLVVWLGTDGAMSWDSMQALARIIEGRVSGQPQLLLPALPLVQVATGTPARSSTLTTTPQPDAVVARSTLNLRSGPGDVYTIVGNYTQGTALRVIGQSVGGEYLKVETLDGKTGWMYKSYLQVNLGMASVPVVAAPSTPTSPPPTVTKTRAPSTPTYTPRPATNTFTPPPPALAAPLTAEMWADAYQLCHGQCVNIYWRTTGASQVLVQNIQRDASGSVQLCLTEPRWEQVLIARNSAGEEVRRTLLFLLIPRITNLSAPGSVSRGQSITIRWKLECASVGFHKIQWWCGGGVECSGSVQLGSGTGDYQYTITAPNTSTDLGFSIRASAGTDSAQQPSVSGSVRVQ